jgi:hypothetical protein
VPKDPDDTSRRARSHWGDDERVAVGRDRRSTPARGIQAERDRDQVTPVTDLLDLIDGLDIIDGPRLKRIVRLIWEHTANVEMRAVQRIPDEQDITKLRADVAAIDADLRREFRELQFELMGRDGTNGKIGMLRGAVEKLLSRAWWFFTVAVGGIGAAAIKLIVVGRTYGELEMQCRANTARVQLLEQVVFLKSQPAAAGKVEP